MGKPNREVAEKVGYSERWVREIARCYERGDVEGLGDPKKVLRRAHPDGSVALWTQDEMRLGPKPVLRKVWAQRGRRPTARVKRRCEWGVGEDKKRVLLVLANVAS